MHRLYENEDIAVFWNSDKCRHAKQCVNGSPRTFNAARRPWIDVTKAPTAEIWQAVSACPSGAVTCTYTHGIRIEYEKEQNRSAAYDGDLLIGECDYRETSEGWNICHTEVRPEYGGKGIARRLVYKVIEAAEQCGNALAASCSYADKILKE